MLEYGVDLQFCPPGAHHANGVAEIFVQLVKRVLHRAREDNPDFGPAQVAVATSFAINSQNGSLLRSFGLKPQPELRGEEWTIRLDRVSEAVRENAMAAYWAARKDLRAKKALRTNEDHRALQRGEVKAGDELRLWKPAPNLRNGGSWIRATYVNHMDTGDLVVVKTRDTGKLREEPGSFLRKVGAEEQ